MKPHDFAPGLDHDDHECSSCEVRIAPPVHMSFTVACPAGDCTSANNPDRGCVFVAQVDVGSRCVFCGRTGGSRPIPEDYPEFEALGV